MVVTDDLVITVGIVSTPFPRSSASLSPSHLVADGIRAGGGRSILPNGSECDVPGEHDTPAQPKRHP